ncbi:hypothetical protein [Ktedonobacter robiniae]|uniref:Uncharacterized protein n=1 Tax=Ktedonobacter robiniae TaxID=2778365 RepID=A0ABQ3V4Y8_9CHLR|nr:hypothetical protein [Ktedonobacter robiniae]GHO59955.1 hypothetical protein KSB_84300 [Ktedonobacter robiniae]
MQYLQHRLQQNRMRITLIFAVVATLALIAAFSLTTTHQTTTHTRLTSDSIPSAVYPHGSPSPDAIFPHGNPSPDAVFPHSSSTLALYPHSASPNVIFPHGTSTLDMIYPGTLAPNAIYPHGSSPEGFSSCKASLNGNGKQYPFYPTRAQRLTHHN